jgi:hypothetical protein
MFYLDFLASAHALLRPQHYLEIGVREGDSLARSSCRSVGIDPAYAIKAQVDCDVALFRTSSDEYFSRPDPLAPTGGARFDLTFIDGMHLFEFALRDFIAAERHSNAGGVIVFDDMLPRTVDEAARIRHTAAWTGDVYSVPAVLARYRPDLTVIPVGTMPTGLLLVLGLDHRNTVLADNYTAIMAEFRSPDPQPVPPSLMDRLGVVPPERVLACDFWSLLADAGPDATPDQVRSALGAALGSSLGPAFAYAG